MNANELIEYYEEAQKDYSRNVLVAPNYEKDVWRKKLHAAMDTISALSHTRIRETATEPPTREDADNYGFVLSRASTEGSDWGLHHRNDVRGNPTLYPIWTQLPEVNT